MLRLLTATLVVICSIANASAAPSACRKECAVEIKNGCSPSQCVGTIYGGVCHAFCSATNQVAPKIEFFNGQDVLELVPKQ